jgi:hypothetical protein
MMSCSEFGMAPIETRTLVVMKEGRTFSICCPLTTPRYEASQDTASVFAAGTSAVLELRGHASETNAYPVIVENASVVINPDLQIEFSRVYTVEHIEKVRNVGRIDRDYLKRLRKGFLAAMGAEFPGDDNREDGDQKESPGGNAFKAPRESQSIQPSRRFVVPSTFVPYSSSSSTATSGSLSSLTVPVLSDKGDTASKPKQATALHPGMERQYSRCPWC